MRNSLHRNRLQLVIALVLSVGLTGFGIAQTRTPSAKKPAATLLSTLPASDAVALIKLKQVLHDALPKLLSANPAKLTEVNAQIEQFKTRTGLDAHSFDELALGLSYKYPSPGVTKLDTVAIARGTFSSAAIVAAGKAAASGKYREEKYQGKTIHVFALDQQLKVLGLFNLKIADLAVSALESDIVCLGDRESVRRAIDARRVAQRGNADLIALATRDESAIVGFGGNISPALIESLRIGNDAIATDLATVRQMYGSFSMTTKDLEILLAARTDNATSARSLGGTVEGLKQVGAMFVNQLSAKKGTLARSALGNLRITTQGNELQIRTAVAQADVAPLIGGL